MVAACTVLRRKHFSFLLIVGDARGNDAGSPIGRTNSPTGKPGSPSTGNSGCGFAAVGGACSSGSDTSCACNVSSVTVNPGSGLTQTSDLGHSGIATGAYGSNSTAIN